MTYLTEAVLVEIVFLDGGTKVEGGIVYEIRRVFGQV